MMSSSEADVIIRNDRDKFDHSTVSKGENDEIIHIDLIGYFPFSK